MTTSMVTIEGLDKADVLAALYNATKPVGKGLLQAAHGPNTMDRAYAQRLIEGGNDITGDYPRNAYGLRSQPLYFDYVHGRPLKLDLSSDVSFDPSGFDRDNKGAAQRAIDYLRKTGNVVNPAITPFEHTKLSDEESMLYLAGFMRRQRDG